MAPYLRSPEFSVRNIISSFFLVKQSLSSFLPKATSNSTLRRARVYVSGLGYFRLYMKGKRIGDEALAPGWTKYRYTVCAFL